MFEIIESILEKLFHYKQPKNKQLNVVYNEEITLNGVCYRPDDNGQFKPYKPKIESIS